jgi:CRISPR-associated protein Cpf1
MGFKYMQAYRCLKKFVNQYTLQKTLRFELVPNPITKKILEIESAKKSFLNDRERNKAREELKEMLKELDNEFIQEALRD